MTPFELFLAGAAVISAVAFVDTTCRAHLAAWRTIAEHGWPGSPARRAG